MCWSPVGELTLGFALLSVYGSCALLKKGEKTQIRTQAHSCDRGVYLELSLFLQVIWVIPCQNANGLRRVSENPQVSGGN